MTREEAVAILESEVEYLYSQDEPYNREAFRMAIEALKAEPKRGRWLNEELFDRGIYFNTQGDCSVCGYHGMATNYCPHCGADMREVEE